MKLSYLFLFLVSLTLNALSLEVIINPYRDIDYDNISVYNLHDDANDCVCYDEQEKYFGQDLSDW